MKKLLLTLITSLALFPAARSQDGPAGDTVQDRDRIQDCAGFVDEDGDGVCDDCGGGQGPNGDPAGCEGFIDEDGDGLCDLCGSDHEPDQDRDRIRDCTPDCPGFVDADGDGVCDNCGGGQGPNGDPSSCPGFVDEDGDGICDNCSCDHSGDGQQARKRFRRGDADGSGQQDVTDGIVILRGLFCGGQIRCEDACDVNDDGDLDIADPVRLLHGLFCGGQPVPPPYRNVGEDPTGDGLGCE